MVYGLNTWLPKLMIEAGYGLNSSLTFLIALQGGAVIGILALSNLCEKYGSKRVISSILYCRCYCFSVTWVRRKYILYFHTSGNCRCCNNRVHKYLIQAYATAFYPAEMRSTGIGVASGIGRFGGMLGPIIGGFLLTLTLPNYINFMVFAVAGIVAAVALMIIKDKYGASAVTSQKVEGNKEVAVSVE